MNRYICVPLYSVMMIAYAYAAPAMVSNRQLGDGNWGTHMAPLVTAVMNTQGPVLELGSGDYSTPLLHAICAAQGRFLLSAESDEKWLRNFLDLETELHAFVCVKQLADWALVGADQPEWSVVFIDHAPAQQRLVDINRLRNNALVFVAHDSNSKCYKDVFTTFKYRYDYKRYKIPTTLVSDTIDVRRWFTD